MLCALQAARVRRRARRASEPSVVGCPAGFHRADAQGGPIPTCAMQGQTHKRCEASGLPDFPRRSSVP